MTWRAVAAWLAIAATLTGCGRSADPLATADPVAKADPVATRLAGRYAHYDVVAYQSSDMKTLIVSFGFTDLAVKDRGLMATESFCHADHRSDQPIETTISDAATSAIKPISTAVKLTSSTSGSESGPARIERPETPTGIGIHLSDPARDLLPTDPNDPRIADDDHDGHPGITVHIKVTDAVQGDLYIARRERFAYDVLEQPDHSLAGTVSDHSEQLIVGATSDIFITRARWSQVPDLTKSPIVLKPVAPNWDCQRLMAARDELFPPTPNVDW